MVWGFYPALLQCLPPPFFFYQGGSHPPNHTQNLPPTFVLVGVLGNFFYVLWKQTNKQTQVFFFFFFVWCPHMSFPFFFKTTIFSNFTPFVFFPQKPHQTVLLLLFFRCQRADGCFAGSHASRSPLFPPPPPLPTFSFLPPHIFFNKKTGGGGVLGVLGRFPLCGVVFGAPTPVGWGFLWGGGWDFFFFFPRPPPPNLGCRFPLFTKKKKKKTRGEVGAPPPPPPHLVPPFFVVESVWGGQFFLVVSTPFPNQPDLNFSPPPPTTKFSNFCLGVSTPPPCFPLGQFVLGGLFSFLFSWVGLGFQIFLSKTLFLFPPNPQTHQKKQKNPPLPFFWWVGKFTLFFFDFHHLLFMYPFFFCGGVW